MMEDDGLLLNIIQRNKGQYLDKILAIVSNSSQVTRGKAKRLPAEITWVQMCTVTAFAISPVLFFSCSDQSQKKVAYSHIPGVRGLSTRSFRVTLCFPLSTDLLIPQHGSMSFSR